MSSNPSAAADIALVDALVHATFEVTGVLSRIGADNDLSLTQLRVLGILRERRPRVTDLAAHLGLDKSTISGLIDRAERRGHLARARSEQDRRAVEVFLTAEGRELTQRMYEAAHRELLPMFARLDVDQRESLERLLDLVLREE
ncbi:MarR family winged helix-turn-helix transcriptional regulator [Microbacterium sp. NPDC089987]|uniref:MarR family winged helix-turn-helix transcriptional regulator n=1 Tax=Microbacterium sp. NPDC089987 TaxID=3364202 RepID=UPI0037FD615F